MFSGWPQFIITQPVAPMMRGDALLLVAGRVIGELGERDLAGGVAALVLAEGAGGRRPSARPRCRRAASAGCGPSVLASIDSSTGASTRISRLLGEAHEARHLVHARRDAGLGQRRGAVLGHPRAFGEPASRDGMFSTIWRTCLRMLSTDNSERISCSDIARLTPDPIWLATGLKFDMGRR